MVAKKTGLGVVLATLLASSAAMADEGNTEMYGSGIPHLDHVFVIMMENHGYGQIINNPNAPWINSYVKQVNLATNYFAVGHPSLTNYLEVVGGSNFGVQSDNSSDWHDANCVTNLASGVPNTDNPPSPNICPISGTGMDAATPAQDFTNEGPPFPLNNIDGVKYLNAAHTYGKTIADQLVAHAKCWKTYQENLPVTGPDLVNYSDGVFSNLTDFSTITPTLTPPLTSGNIVQLYASKHNPFVYFRNIQEGSNPFSSYKNMSGFDGANGLYSDLANGSVPNYSFIVPNQCNDQHGRGNSTAFCNYDPNDNGTQAGLNPALIQLGDVAVQKLVTAIKQSPAWSFGNNAIVLVWDENDYSQAPNVNQVVLTVDTSYGAHGKTSATYYNHFSLLKSVEAGLGLPCLNHACDADVAVMSDLFAR